ncbi:hypothetical protein [Alteribacter aurantiacus]|uniref:hypothetical protein n=1 Tax=Alteribacter aurantiacus TaxID=254410 RepID=UPI00040D7C51|nr:hypothetical protein [Alteribacter aurantiacus]
MENKRRILDGLLFGLIALFLWIDFFNPDFFLTSWMVIVLLIAVVILRVALLKGRKVEGIVFGIVFNIYFMLMLILFNFMGGQSQVGFSFDDFFFWVIVVLFAYDTQKRWSKYKHVKETSQNK